MRKMNKKIEIALLIVVALLTFAGAVYSAFASDFFSLGYYSYTKAFCSGNKCQDFLVECSNENLISFKAISEVKIFSDEWKDIRGGNSKEELCN